MLFRNSRQPYNLRYCYLLAGFGKVGGMIKRGASIDLWVFHNQERGREIFGILQNQYPTYGEYVWMCEQHDIEHAE
jgi:hypothetical protein